MTPELDLVMDRAFRLAGVPLWVPPSHVRYWMTAQRWSDAIALELCEWFARVWSLSFAAGYLGAKRFTVDEATARRMLEKMGYGPGRAIELAALLGGPVAGLYDAGRARRPDKGDDA